MEPGRAGQLTARYAIYLVPPENHPLYHFGQHFLGRDAHLCGPLAQPVLEGVYPERLAAITEAPRHYGFHATLKPPFRLADRQSDEALHKEVEKFVARQIPFTIPELEIGVLDRFIAVKPSWPCTALQLLGDDCLRAFDVFRAPPSEEERAKRQAAGLTPAQEKLLERWGYPYVIEDFRPHFSLTERIEDSAERYTVHQAIRTICEPESLADVTVDSISIFGQPDTRMPFYQIARFQFCG